MENRSTARAFVIPEGLQNIVLLFGDAEARGTVLDISAHGLGITIGDPVSVPQKGTEVVVRSPLRDLRAICVYMHIEDTMAHVGLFVHLPYDQDFLFEQLGAHPLARI